MPAARAAASRSTRRAPATPSDAASTPAASANSFASFLLDWPNTVQRDLKVFDDPGTQHTGLFAFIQDKWQARSNVTVDLGLRWEYYTPLEGLEGAGSLSNYDPATHTLRVAGYGDTDEALNVKKKFTQLRAADRRLLAPQREERPARGLRREHDSVPGQPLRVQLPGEAELRGDRGERVPARGVDGHRVPGAGAARHPVERDHPGQRRRCRTRRSTSSRTTCTRPRCTRGTSPTSVSLPYLLTADVAYVGNRGVRHRDGRRHQRQPDLRFGQQRPAAVRDHSTAPAPTAPAPTTTSRSTTACR